MCAAVRAGHCSAVRSASIPMIQSIAERTIVMPTITVVSTVKKVMPTARAANVHAVPEASGVPSTGNRRDVFRPGTMQPAMLTLRQTATHAKRRHVMKIRHVQQPETAVLPVRRLAVIRISSSAIPKMETSVSPGLMTTTVVSATTSAQHCCSPMPTAANV